MATHEAILAIKVIADSTQAAAGLDQAKGKAGKFQSAVSKMTGPAIAAGVAVAAIGKKAIDSAAKLQQSQGAVEAVFGAEAKAVEKYAASAATTMGLSAADYNNYAALVGGALQAAGVSVKDSVGESNKLMQRAADLAATYGGTTADAVDAVNAAVSRGEFDPLEKYNVQLNMTAVNAELAARGQDKLTGKQAKAAKSAIILEQIYSSSAKTAGQYAREQDTASGAAATAAAEWENASAALGTALLPAVTAVTRKLSALAGFLSKHTTTTQILIGVIAGLAAGILILNVALKAYTLATMLAGNEAAKTWLKVLGPIGLAIAAIVAVVLIVRHLWKTSATFRKVVLAVWSAIKTAATAAGKAIQRAFTSAWSKISAAARAMAAVVRAVWNGIKSAISGVITIVGRLIGRVRDIKVPDAIRNAFDRVKTTIGNVISKVADLIAKIRNISVPGSIKAAFDAVKTSADKVLTVIKSIVDWIKNIKVPHIDWPSPPKWFDKVTGRSALPPETPAVAGARTFGVAPAPAVAGLGARASVASRGFPPIQINVIGAMDPEGVARQIKKIMGGHDRRIGGQVR